MINFIFLYNFGRRVAMTRNNEIRQKFVRHRLQSVECRLQEPQLS